MTMVCIYVILYAFVVPVHLRTPNASRSRVHAVLVSMREYSDPRVLLCPPSSPYLCSMHFRGRTVVGIRTYVHLLSCMSCIPAVSDGLPCRCIVTNNFDVVRVFTI